MKFKCGCKDRKILKSEIEDYPKGTSRILDYICPEHEKAILRELDFKEKMLNEMMPPMTKEEMYG